MPNQYAMRFISGKYQGGEFPLGTEREYIIGRGSDVDVVLVEDMVSRKHARLVARGGEIRIHDLDSTNGTFVNGEKVHEAHLREGDRILIGTSIFKLIATEETQVSESDAKRRLELTGARRATNSTRMSGAIDEIPLPDLMQLLSTSRKSGVLVVHHGDSGDGRIYFRKGQIYFATVDDSMEIRAHKAVYRMLGWTTGTFVLEPPDEQELPDEIQDSTEALLMEGMRQLDEQRHLERELPRRDATLRLCTPLRAPLRDLPQAELDIVQSAFNRGRVQAVLDESPHDDLRTLMILKRLVELGYLVVE